MRPQQPIHEFIEQLLANKYGKELKQSKYKIKKAELLKNLYTKSYEKALNALSYQDLIEFRDLLDQRATEDQLLLFMEKHIPDLHLLLADTLIEFRIQYLSNKANQ